MAFIILKLKGNVEEPYAIYDLEKIGLWPIRKKSLTVGSILGEEIDIKLIINPKVRKRSLGEIIKTDDGWRYKLIDERKKTLEGMLIHGIKIPIFDNVIEFKEEL